MRLSNNDKKLFQKKRAEFWQKVKEISAQVEKQSQYNLECIFDAYFGLKGKMRRSYTTEANAWRYVLKKRLSQYGNR